MPTSDKELLQLSNEDLVTLYINKKMSGNKQEADHIFELIVQKNIEMIHKHVIRIIVEKPDKKTYEDDMNQVAMIALMKAVEKYNPNFGAAFHTYAYANVQHALYDWIADNHLIHIPRHKQHHIAVYYGIVNNYKNKHNGTTPSDEYVKHMMGVTEQQYKDIRAAISASYIDSLDNHFSADGECHIPYNQDPHDIIQKRDAKLRLSDIISNLKNAKERQVIIDYYYGNKNIHVISKNSNVTDQRISKLKNNGVKHLAKISEINEIADVLLN